MLDPSRLKPITGSFVTPFPNELEDWHAAAREILARNGIDLWANVETFKRPAPTAWGSNMDFRQIDYRILLSKLEAASSADKLITFEFSTCLSPNAEWGSAGRLLERYVEALGIKKDDVAWPGNGAPGKTCGPPWRRARILPPF